MIAECCPILLEYYYCNQLEYIALNIVFSIIGKFFDPVLFYCMKLIGFRFLFCDVQYFLTAIEFACKCSNNSNIFLLKYFWKVYYFPISVF